MLSANRLNGSHLLGRVRRRCALAGCADLGEDFDTHVPAGLGPFVVLLHEHRADEADGGVTPGEDADHVGPAPDFSVQALLGIGRPDLPPGLPRHGCKGEQVVAGAVQVGSRGRELTLQRGHDPAELGRDLGGVRLVEDGPHEGGDPRLARLGDLRKKITKVVAIVKK